jgi:hypothetical protein
MIRPWVESLIQYLEFYMNHRISPYAPIRLQHEFWWEFAREVSQQGFVVKNGNIAANLPDLIMHELVLPVMSKAAETESNALPEIAGTALSFRHWIPLVGQYELNGKQIFDLDDGLVEMLANTGLGDTTLKDWMPVYDAFYVRFGKQDNCKLEFDNGPDELSYEYFDGAFVAVTPTADDGTGRRIKIGLTTVKGDGSGVFLPGHFLDLNEREQSMPVIEGIRAALSRREEELEADLNNQGDEYIVDIMRSRHREASDLMESAAALVINGLYYLSEYQSDRKRQPGRDTPPSMEMKWRSSGAKKKSMTTKLAKKGYTIVNMCGALAVSGRASKGAVGDRSAHWRRGHWRSQPYGEGRSERRNVWIKPVLVGGATDQPNSGHIYQAGVSDAKQ